MTRDELMKWVDGHFTDTVNAGFVSVNCTQEQIAKKLREAAATIAAHEATIERLTAALNKIVAVYDEMACHNKTMSKDFIKIARKALKALKGGDA